MLGRVTLAALLGTTVAACSYGPWVVAGPHVLIAPGNLVGTEWVLDEVGGHHVVDYAQGTLTFPATGTIAGNGSCNRFTGTVEISGETIKVGPLAASRKVCPPSIMAQEIKYLRALEDSDRIVMDGAYLLLFANDVEHPLRFAPLE